MQCLSKVLSRALKGPPTLMLPSLRIKEDQKLHIGIKWMNKRKRPTPGFMKKTSNQILWNFITKKKKLFQMIWEKKTKIRIWPKIKFSVVEDRVMSWKLPEVSNFDLDFYTQKISQVRRQNKDIFRHVRTLLEGVLQQTRMETSKVDVRTQETVEMIQEWNEKEIPEWQLCRRTRQ